MLTPILHAISFVAYLVGYISWYLATIFYPEYQRKPNTWYGFSSFKDQFQTAALLGTVATIFCLAAPVLTIPTVWLYVLSNLIWSIGEYHKKVSFVAQDAQYSSAKQAVYFRYSALVTLTSTIGAIAATAVALFPAMALCITFYASIAGLISTTAALCHWGACAFCRFPPDQIPQSYGTIAECLPIKKNERANAPVNQSRPPCNGPSALSKFALDKTLPTPVVVPLINPEDPTTNRTHRQAQTNQIQHGDCNAMHYPN